MTIRFCLSWYTAAAAAKSLQSCRTLCDPIDGSPPGSPFPGILQARTLGWVAISFSNAWKRKVKVKSLSRVWLFATPWTAAHQAPPSTGVGCHRLLHLIYYHLWNMSVVKVLGSETWLDSYFLLEELIMLCLAKFNNENEIKNIFRHNLREIFSIHLHQRGLFPFPFLHFSFFKICSTIMGEGNGNPLQYSRLENPMDRRAW